MRSSASTTTDNDAAMPTTTMKSAYYATIPHYTHTQRVREPMRIKCATKETTSQWWTRLVQFHYHFHEVDVELTDKRKKNQLIDSISFAVTALLIPKQISIILCLHSVFWPKIEIEFNIFHRLPYLLISIIYFMISVFSTSIFAGRNFLRKFSKTKFLSCGAIEGRKQQKQQLRTSSTTTTDCENQEHAFKHQKLNQFDFPNQIFRCW